VVTRTQPVFGLNLLFYLSKILKFKLIHTLASDLEVLTEGIHKLSSFQKVLKKLDFVIAQNEYQKLVFKKNIRNIEIPVIPNIWDSSIFESMNKTTDLFFDVIWVGNIRHIKRPEYFLELARAYPDLKFGMIGIKIEKNLYEICKSASEELSNLQLLGYRNLYETTYIISKSKVLICTSINEGFPNTFLQAWSVPIPVLSTVNPNKAITRFDLGIVADKLDGLSAGLTKILSDNGYYKKLQKNITNYFGVTHSPEINYEVFESYIK
jgi:glycosyltransferase involved in cell wall biosynthesis